MSLWILNSYGNAIYDVVNGQCDRATARKQSELLLVGSVTAEWNDNSELSAI